MNNKNAVGLLALATVAAIVSSLPAGENFSVSTDLFSMDGRSIITDPGHLGIINGRLGMGHKF